MLRPFKLICFMCVALVIQSAAWAEGKLVIAVEDRSWSPFYVWTDGELSGPCSEIAEGAFAAMGYEVEFQRAPWTRVLKSVEDQSVHGGLCATMTPERDAYAIFHDEPLLHFDTTLFVLESSPLTSSDPAALTGMSFATVKGYSFGGMETQLVEAGMERRDANSRDSLIRVLLAGRVDAILDSTLPILVDADRLGVMDQVRPLRPTLSQTPSYVMFSEMTGNDVLAAEFSDALKAFKETAAYREIQLKYNMYN
ncbi:MAG: transporter substrate-binding domain-containing protein [Pseudomonadota bacterium]